MELLKQTQKKLRHYFDIISNLGVDFTTDLHEQQRVKLLNQIVLITIILQTLLILEGVFLGDFYGVFFGLISTIICGLPIYLNYRNRQSLAIWTFCIYSPLSIGVITILYGQEVNTTYSYIIFCVHIVIFLRQFISRLIFASYVAVVYYVAFLYTENYPSPLAREFSFMEENAIFGASFLFVVLVLRSYTNLVNDNFKKIQSLLKKETERQKIIEQQNTELVQANSELEKFAYIASHDLKSPLRNVSSFISLIERKIKRGQTDNILEDLGFAKRASQQMYRLIEDILRYSRMREQELSFEKISLSEVIADISYTLQSTFQQRNAELYCEPLPTLEGNRSQLILLFQNLIENGIKYNENSNPKITISCTTEENSTIISIQDNGIGIPKDYQERVFEMFARLHNQQQYEGTGLGLAICKRIVNAHHGDIWLESKEGEGATFFIKLPLHQDKSITQSLTLEQEVKV